MKNTMLKQIPTRDSRDLPGVITVGLHYIQGNSDAYWTITAWYGGSRTGWGGCAHEEILARHPELAPFVALHLSESGGTPMHAAANGLYWAGRGRYSEYAPRTLASHLRISVEAAESLIERLAGLPLESAQAEMGAFVDSLRAGWQAEADRALELFNSLPGEIACES